MVGIGRRKKLLTLHSAEDTGDAAYRKAPPDRYARSRTDR
jgi:hypothetical protein